MFCVSFHSMPSSSHIFDFDRQCPADSCVTTVLVVADVNGFAQRSGHSNYNVAGCEGDGVGGNAVNHAGDVYTGCNWQSVDLIDFAVPAGEAVIGVDALDAGGTGAMIATVRVDGGDVYPSSSERWRCWEGGGHGGDDGADWSQVSNTWHGTDGPNGWELPGFDDTAWESAHSRGLNGVGPWGNVNRDMGFHSKGNVSADSEWIWTSDFEAHNGELQLSVHCVCDSLQKP